MNNSLPNLSNPVAPLNSVIPTPMQQSVQPIQPLAAPIVSEQPAQSRKKSSNILVIALVIVVLALAGFIGYGIYQIAIGDANKTNVADDTTSPVVDEPEVKKDVFFANWYKLNNSIEEPSNTTSTLGRIALGLEGSGDVNATNSASVIKVGNKYKMWYAGNDDDKVLRIYYAESTDNLTWTKIDNSVPANSDTTSTNGRIPLGTAGKLDSDGVSSPTVVYKDNEYKMWYCGSNRSNRYIGYATSSDGLAWTKYDNSIPTDSDTTSTNGRIPNGSAGRIDEEAACGPEVIWDIEDQLYKMWYSSSLPGYIAMATSSDGLNWTKVDNTIPERSDTVSTNGRIANGNIGTRDYKYLRNPAVVKIDGKYHMWYVSEHDEGSQSLGYATSSDGGYTWIKYNNSMDNYFTISNGYSKDGYLFRGNSEFTLDFNGFGIPGLFFDNNKLYMYVVGIPGGDNKGRIQTAVSYDYLD